MVPLSSPPSSASAESPIDRALTLLLAGEYTASLRWSAALLQSEVMQPVPFIAVARALAVLGHAEPADLALRLGIQAAVDSGNLPMAIAACCELREQGRDPAEQLDEIARCFAKDSERLLEKGVLPPSLPGKNAGEFQALAEDLADAALLEAVGEILKRAQALLEAQRAGEAARPKVSHQTLFSSLSVSGLRAFIEVFDMQIVPTSAVIIEQGTIGAEAYILARGEVEVQRTHVDAGDGDGPATIRLARLGSGALFGEMALLSRSPRAASVVACRPSIVLVATKQALDKVAAHEPDVGVEFADHCRRRMLENLVRTSSILSTVARSERPSLVDAFVTCTFEQGERIIRQDQESDGLYLVASGEVAVVHKEGDEGTVITKLGAGEVVGEVALVLRRPANADVIAEHPTVLLHLPRERFHDLIKQHPEILAELYELAVKREEETLSIVEQEATELDEFVLV